jgi:uncharacterized protein YjbI with pentapeptide repeats
MVLPDRPRRPIDQSRTYFPWLIVIPVVIVIIGVVVTFRDIILPGGIGIGADEPVTRTVEFDSGHNLIKTVETIKKDPGKTLWDWLSLLGVPTTLAIFGYWLQQIQQKRAEAITKDQLEIAANENREDSLQVYIDRLSSLLVEKNLLAIATKHLHAESEAEQLDLANEKELLDSAVDVIRARTLSILRRFENDAERKTSVLQFLLEADFISRLKLDLSRASLSKVELFQANLCGATLNQADLRGADLSGASLIQANLSRSNLSGADLSGADLSDADLSWANLSGADLGEVKLTEVHPFGSANERLMYLSGAKLRQANLSCADLSKANLRGADLSGANLSEADLSGANLSGANLSEADLSGANLSEANLSGANLSRANFNEIEFGDPSRNLTVAQVKLAKNWRKAKFNPEFRKELLAAEGGTDKRK